MATVAALALSLAGGTVATAAAAVQASMTPTFPAAVTVGDQAVATSLHVQNQSDGANAGDSLRIDSIAFTPSCGSQAPVFACPAGSEDPGVFSPSGTAVGRTGTACAGVVFSTALVDPVSGRYSLTASGSPLVLGPGAACDIDFTMNVLKAPTKDASVNPGVQTAMYATVSATDLTAPSDGITTSALGTRTTTVAVQAAPTVTTGLPTSVGSTTATLSGTVNPNGVATTFVFEFGTSTAFGSITTPTSAGAGTNPVNLTANMSGLAPNTTYYYRVVATNSVGTSTGIVRSFRTTGTASPPVALTGNASAVTTSGATLNGQVNPKGSQTYYTFEYGTSTAFGQITPVVALDDADALEPVSASLTGLAPNTTYLYRTVATNATGTTAGPVSAFTTGPGGAPVVTTGAATGVTATSATLNGTVNPNASQTAYTFEYGTTTAFGSLSAVESAGQVSGPKPFALPITGLAPNTTYLYRIVATNANGTTTGEIGSFETAAAT
jgi:phosphodiesterase/alkaline phosphatase D-like protein